jgi:ABC-type spermidine/putrescine transport system permease subunit II
MADLALTTAGRIEIVDSEEQMTHPAGVALIAGNSVVSNSNGAWILADSVTNKLGIHIALRSAALGEPGVTAVRKGLIDGFNIAAMLINAPIYVSDVPGAIATGTGTGNIQIGRVVAAHAQPNATAPDKIIRLDAPL